MPTDSSKHFFATLDEQQSFLVERLKTTIAQLASGVQQQGEMALPHFLSSLLQQVSYKVETLDHGVHARYRTGNGPTLLLFSHCPPQLDAFDRWETLATRLLTITFYQEIMGNLPVNVSWQIELGEQEKQRSFLAEPEDVSQGSGCLYDLAVTDALTKPMLALGTKGLLGVDMEVQTAQVDDLINNDAILTNAAWRLLWALHNIKNSQEEILIDGFYDTLVPMKDEETAFLHTNPDIEPLLQQELQTENFLHLHGFQLWYSYSLLPTCTITRLHSGSVTHEPQHILPSFAQASLAIHLVPEQEPQDIYEKLRHHLDTHGFEDVKTTMQVSIKPQHATLHEPFTSHVLATARDIYGTQLTILPLLPHLVTLDPPEPVPPILYTQLGTPSGVEGEQQAQMLHNAMQFLVRVMEGIADNR